MSSPPPRPPPPKAPPSGSEEDPFTIRIGSFNINGKSPRDTDGNLVDITTWIGPEARADICVFGFQELDLDSQTLMLNIASPKADDWVAAINACLPNGVYEKLECNTLVGVVIVVYVKKSLRKQIRNVLTGVTPTGMLGFGNKGGVGIRFDIDTTGFCFLCAHFAAHQGAVQKRNEDYETIVQKIQFWTPKEGAVQNSSQVFQHDRVFFCGDLNYRIDGDADTVRNLATQSKHDELYETDQLNVQRQMGAVFRGWEENTITFPPTYKYDPGTNTFDTSAKQRIPAWCDRVLWLAPSGCGITPVDGSYTSHPEIMFSDHKPVSAQFKVSLCSVADTPISRPAILMQAQEAANITSKLQSGLRSFGQSMKSSFGL